MTPGYYTPIIHNHDSEFYNKGFYLNEGYNWGIVKDYNGTLCLVPTKNK